MAKLNLKYVNSFIDRHGRRRYQCRVPGQKSFGLPGLPGSAEFMEAYQAALAQGNKSTTDIGASRTKSGTLNAGIVGYYAHDSFTKGLAPETQRMRRNILERFRAMRAPSGQTYGDKQFATIEQRHIVAILETLSPDAQKNWLKTLRGLMGYGVIKQLRKDDPTGGVKSVKVGKSIGHMTWLEPQVEQYRECHKLGTVARLAIEMVLNVAARRGDLHILGKQHVHDGRLCWRPRKTLRSTGKMLRIRIMPELQAALDAMPASESLTFLVNEYGQPFRSAAAFGNKFADWCVEAGLKPVLCDDGKVRNYRLHGLRKTSLRTYAHSDSSDRQLMAVSGHSDPRQLREYLAETDQEQMADDAVDKVLRKRAATDQTGNANLQTSNTSPTNRKVSV
jgi:integrase